MAPKDGDSLPRQADPNARLRAAIAACPADGNLRMLLGRNLMQSGDSGGARATLADAARLGTAAEVFDMLARATLPGPSYTEHLRALHEFLQPATYLEIGVFMGASLALAGPGTQAIGIDPAPLPESDRAYAAPTTIHRLTSNAYFAQAGTALPSPDPVDMAFIDGLHVFEQVLLDFINVERHCHLGSVVALHDTLPVAPEVAARDRATRHWTGDVWKIVPCLRAFRPDLRLLTIPAYPSGLTLVMGLDRSSTVLEELYPQAVAAFIGAALPRAPDLAPAPDIANDYAAIGTWLRTTQAELLA